ncbi:hypothetical protein [Bernardetia sp.]|uniref:hypothetical protein n=1 Tax=Bernardetia sp. TaxID=1937974 RepID=UPI0025BB992B|nr:hypothetical protein [Bernardetia sp.]
MYYSHYLEKDKHQDFLLQQRVDPITGERIEAGDKVVFCASCKSAFFEESWQYLEGKHCNQTKTLKNIPVAKTLWLKAKPLEFLPFDFKGFDVHVVYKTLIYKLLKSILVAGFYLSVIFAFLAVDERDLKRASVLSILAIAFVPLTFGYEQVLKQLPAFFRNYFIQIDKKHRLAIDSKKQTIILRGDFQELELPLSSIHKMDYSFNYVYQDTSRYKDMCDLKVTLGFSEKGIYKERTLTAQFRKIYFYKWEEFCQKLPQKLQVA